MLTLHSYHPAWREDVLVYGTSTGSVSTSGCTTCALMARRRLCVAEAWTGTLRSARPEQPLADTQRLRGLAVTRRYTISRADEVVKEVEHAVLGSSLSAHLLNVYLTFG